MTAERPGERVRIKVRTHWGEEKKVAAFTTLTPGLVAVPPQVAYDNDWSLTHLLTGYAVGWFDDPEMCQKGAVLAAPVADWLDPSWLDDRLERHAIGARLAVALGPLLRRHGRTGPDLKVINKVAP